MLLQWRHHERDIVSNRRRLDCLLNRLFHVSVKFVYKCPINNKSLLVQIMAYYTDAHMRRSDLYVSKLILQLRGYEFARHMTRWNEIFAAHAA